MAKPFRILIVIEGGTVEKVVEEGPMDGREYVGFEYIIKDFDNLREGDAGDYIEFHEAHKDEYTPELYEEIMADVEDGTEEEEEEEDDDFYITAEDAWGEQWGPYFSMKEAQEGKKRLKEAGYHGLEIIVGKDGDECDEDEE
jgi:hypothetical protein